MSSVAKCVGEALIAVGVEGLNLAAVAHKEKQKNKPL